MALEISNLVGGTISEFINLALTTVVIMIIWYVIKFFLVASSSDETKKTAAEERRKKITDWLGKKKDESEKKKEAKKRENLLKPTLGLVILAGQAAEKIKDDELNDKTDAAVTSAKDVAGEIKNHLSTAIGLVKTAKNREKTEKREFLHKLNLSLGVALKTYNDHIKNKIPAATVSDTNWRNGVDSVKHYAEKIEELCYLIHTIIEKFIDEDKLEITVPGAPGAPGRVPPSPPVTP